MEGTDTASPVARGLLAAGVLALVGAILTAHRSPATGYEVSLYAATPQTVWLLLGVSMAVSVVVVLWTPNVWTRRLSLGLGGGTALTFVAMPVIRGYWFISGGDALTHLGWARGIESGGFHPAELHYPGMHLASAQFANASGIELQHAMMLVILVLFGLFVTFVSLSVGVVIDRPHAVTIGAFGAFLLLPITNLSMYVTPHTMSQAVLFSAVVVYLLLVYVRTDGDGAEGAPSESVAGDPVVGVGMDRPSGAPIGVLLSLALVAIVVYHPQLAAHLLAILVGCCAVQLYARRRTLNLPVKRHRTLYAHTGVLAGAFLVWTSNHDFIQNVVRFHLTSTIEFFTGDATAGDAVESQGDSLAEIGGSFFEVFLKLLGPAFVAGVIALMLIAWLYLADNGQLDRATGGLLHYFAIALVGLAGLFAIYFLGSAGQMYFRVFGFSLLILTIAGSVAVTYVVTSDTVTCPRFTVRSLVAVGFCLLFVVSMVAFFPSPYVYDASPHVSEQMMTGHAAALHSTPEDVPIDGIRSGPNRYSDAISEEINQQHIHGSVDSEDIERGFTHDSNSHQYLIVDRQDTDREVAAYNELRYTEPLFSSLPHHQQLNKVQSNGEVDLYHVRSVQDR